MKDDEILEKLGYLKSNINDCIKFSDFEKSFDFDLKNKKLMPYCHDNYDCFSLEISVEEIKAIYEFVKKLGWLDE